MPTSFDQAASLLPDNAKDETLLATNQFEIVYQGSLKAIADPASTYCASRKANPSNPLPADGIELMPLPTGIAKCIAKMKIIFRLGKRNIMASRPIEPVHHRVFPVFRGGDLPF